MQIERNAVRQRVAGVMLTPAAVAMNVMAIICIAVGLICRLQRPRNIEIPAGIPCGVPVLLVVGIGGVGVLDGRS